MAKASNYVYYANGNEASKEFLNEDVIGDPAIYPDEATVENLYTVTPYPRRCSGRHPAWTKVKSGSDR
jgi:putrescine transport system substrate-binding protein